MHDLFDWGALSSRRRPPSPPLSSRRRPGSTSPQSRRRHDGPRLSPGWRKEV